MSEMIKLPRLPDVAIEDVLAASFRDFHARGMDYICLRRSPAETVKLYFFDGDVSKLPEVVNPHDHRYDFSTLCVAGRVQNIWFGESEYGEAYQRFSYETPLLGGNGFTWAGESKLGIRGKRIFAAGRRYWMDYNQIHTIRMIENNTVICLVQHEDRVTNHPTQTFTREREPPSLGGLYNRFTPDQIMRRLAALSERVPGINLPRIT